MATDGDLWRDQRRFTLHVLRNFGMGRTLIEDIVSWENPRPPVHDHFVDYGRSRQTSNKSPRRYRSRK